MRKICQSLFPVKTTAKFLTIANLLTQRPRVLPAHLSYDSAEGSYTSKITVTPRHFMDISQENIKINYFWMSCYVALSKIFFAMIPAEFPTTSWKTSKIFPRSRKMIKFFMTKVYFATYILKVFRKLPQETLKKEVRLC